MARELPYFDHILDVARTQPGAELSTAFARHVHWGCYDDGGTDDTSLAGYLAAAEAMTERVCGAAGVASGQRILDVGCGFGGTIAHLDERLVDVDLVGLNIDARQIDVARESVRASASNQVRFEVGDACELPFDDASFDVVLAVECIFHFPSRKKFLREAARVLRPGGALALTDFVLREGGLAELTRWAAQAEHADEHFYGSNAKPITSAAYARLAPPSGLRLWLDDDLTPHTLPTYAALRRLYLEAGIDAGAAASDYLEGVARQGLVQYRLLAFDRPTGFEAADTVH